MAKPSSSRTDLLGCAARSPKAAQTNGGKGARSPGVGVGENILKNPSPLH